MTAQRGRAQEAHMIIRLTGLVILTAITIFAFAMSPAGSNAPTACGPSLQILDPGLRATFEKFERTQSPTAAKACGFFQDTVVASR
jgi:hypothetical protein